MTETLEPPDVASASPRVRWPGNGTLAVADQAVVSGASFATSVIVARACTPEEFGGFSLVLGLALLARSVVGEVVASPYTVYAPRYRGPDLGAYTGSALIHYLALTAVVVAALFAAAPVLGRGAGLAGGAALAVAAASPFLLVREFARRVDLAQLELPAVFAADVAIAVAQIGGLLLLWHSELLTAGSAFAVLGAVSAVGCAAWFVGRRGTIRVVRDRLAPDWQHNWRFGRWAVAGFVVGSTPPFILPWVLAVTHGEADVGRLAACATLMNLAGTYVTGVANVLTPRAARAYTVGGAAELRRVLAQAGVLFGVTLGGFCLVVALTGDMPTRLVYGSGYAGTGPILTLLALTALVNAAGVTAGNGLWALGRPRANVVADVCHLVVTVALAAGLVGPFGPVGAAGALLGGAAVGAGVRVWTLARAMCEVRGNGDVA